MPSATDDPNANWRALFESYTSYITRLNEFLTQAGDRVIQIRRGLMSSSPPERAFALTCFERLDISEQRSLLDLLVGDCTDVRVAVTAREIIRALPRDFVLANVEQCARGYTDGSDYMDYAMLMDLYDSLDKDLMMRLVTMAKLHADPDIRELAVEEEARENSSPASE